METVRMPAVAGLFYPADPGELASVVDRYMADVADPEVYSRAVVAPHAGYVYSGRTAGYAHKNLDPTVKRVLVLGPTHRVGIEGMALTGADWQQTPLGRIKTDEEITGILETEFSEVITAPIVHAQEHSMEVQLPFLQRHLTSDFTVVPLAVGQCDAEAVARVIRRFWHWPDTAIVVSSDLSHYLPYEEAQVQDQRTIEQILAGGPDLNGQQACGTYPLSGLMNFARSEDLSVKVLDACNSGDTAGDRQRVVGYAAIAWYPPENVAGPSPLTALAYNAIAQKFGQPGMDIGGLETDADFVRSLDEPGATFVTITIDGQLRGCMGSIEADRPLREDLSKNALAAAFGDPRFPPLTAGEWEIADLEVSELTPLKPMVPQNSGQPLTEAEVLSRLRPGVDGVLLRFGPRRATFLPQVWEQLPEPQRFLSHLKAKAGLPGDFWDPNIEVETYQVSASHLPRGKPEERRRADRGTRSEMVDPN